MNNLVSGRLWLVRVRARLGDYRPQGQNESPPCLRPCFRLAAPVTAGRRSSGEHSSKGARQGRSSRSSFFCLMSLLSSLGRRGGVEGVTTGALSPRYDPQNCSYSSTLMCAGSCAIWTRLVRWTSFSGNHSSSTL